MAKGYVGAPTSYTPVEYIESTGTQYIDTGLAQNGYHSVIDTSINNFNSLQIITGTYGPADNQRFYTRINTDGSLVTQFGGYSGSNLIAGPTLTTNTRYIINTKLFNGTQNLTVNGTSYGSQSVAAQTFPQANIYLFAIWSDGVAANQCSCKLYSAKYYDSNNTLIRNFIPATDQDGVACLYEQVEGKFYYNAGSGTFAAGSTTGQPVSIGSRAKKLKKGYVGVPASYTPVEYIESSGTQWIDTGVNALNNELELRFQYTDLSSTTYVSGSSDGTNRFGLIANRPANNDICYGDKSNNYYTLGTADTNEHTVVYNNSSNQVVYDGVVKGTLPNLTTQVARPLGLFALSGSNGGATYAHTRIMYCKVTDKSTNTLIRNFIPVIDQDNVACMYEQVEGKFYYNKGTGTFTAGTATGQPVLLSKARRIKKGYVGVNGVARLCWSSGYSWEDFHQFLVYCKANVTTYLNGYMPGVINTLVNNWATLETKMQEKGVSTDGYKNFWLYYSGGNSHPVIQMSKEDISYECQSSGYWKIPSPITYLRFDFNYNDVSSITETATEANYSRNSVGIFSTEPTNGDYYTTQLQNIWI